MLPKFGLARRKRMMWSPGFTTGYASPHGSTSYLVTSPILPAPVAANSVVPLEEGPGANHVAQSSPMPINTPSKRAHTAAKTILHLRTRFSFLIEFDLA